MNCVTENNEPRPITAAELAAERIARDPAGMARDAARAQAVVDNLNRNVLKDATAEERAGAGRSVTLAKLASRMRCSSCGKKVAEVVAVSALAFTRVTDAAD
jgi:hypothetical protein